MVWTNITRGRYERPGFRMAGHEILSELRTGTIILPAKLTK